MKALCRLYEGSMKSLCRLYEGSIKVCSQVTCDAREKYRCSFRLPLSGDMPQA